MLEIYKRIRARREELGISQEELAKRMGYKSRSSINKIEKGENDIPQSKIIAFAQALRTTPESLMGWEQPTAPDRSSFESDGLPSLTAKDERQIAHDLENMVDSLNGAAAMSDDPEDEEDREMLRAALLHAMTISKRMAKKKFTPKKYRRGD